MEKDEDNKLKLEQNKNPQQSRNNMNDNTNIFMKSEDRQNFNPINITSPVTVINNGDVFSKLMSTKMVRILLNSKYACVTGYKKQFYVVNAISRIDDNNPENENELPLFEIEENTSCCLCICCEPDGVKFDVFDALTKQIISVIQTRQNTGSVQEYCGCCGENYDVFPPTYNYKCINPSDISIVKRYDSRSFYRTFEYFGRSYYKLGEPYVPHEKTCSESICECYASSPCCFCCRHCCCSDCN